MERQVDKSKPRFRINLHILSCNNLVLQPYLDAKCRIGRHHCPYCKEENQEFDEDTTVQFKVFKKLEVFTPNRLVGYKGDSVLYYEDSRLYHICLCTAELFCKTCGNIIPVYHTYRYIDQMGEIIDHLKQKEIAISMPRPPGDSRYLITYFKILDLEASREYEEDDDEDNDAEDKPRGEYTEECVHQSTIIPGTGKSFLQRDLGCTYTIRN